MSKTPANKQRRVCYECGMETNPGGVALHQKATGHTGYGTPSQYAEEKKNVSEVKKVVKEVAVEPRFLEIQTYKKDLQGIDQAIGELHHKFNANLDHLQKQSLETDDKFKILSLVSAGLAVGLLGCLIILLVMALS